MPTASRSGSRSRHFDDDEDDDSDSDDGLLMKPRAKVPPKESAASSISKQHLARRRDTDTSIASVETARKDGD